MQLIEILPEQIGKYGGGLVILAQNDQENRVDCLIIFAVCELMHLDFNW